MSIPEITVDELAAGGCDAGAALLDVRQPDEYVEAHVPGARLIPLNDVPDRLASCPAGGEVLVICRSGGRSLAACDFLVANGVDRRERRRRHAGVDRERPGGRDGRPVTAQWVDRRRGAALRSSTAAAAAPAYALDTEFHRERTYYPQLALVQLRWDGRTALIDPLAVDVAPLGEVLAGPGSACCTPPSRTSRCWPGPAARCRRGCSTRSSPPASSATAPRRSPTWWRPSWG